VLSLNTSSTPGRKFAILNCLGNCVIVVFMNPVVLACIPPFEGFRHGSVEIIHEIKNPFLKIFDRTEACPAQSFAHENTKPHLNLIQPRGMLRRIVKDDVMASVPRRL
jgi:hypothetical protein